MDKKRRKHLLSLSKKELVEIIGGFELFLKAFDFLKDEPDLYNNNDFIQPEPKPPKIENVTIFDKHLINDK